MTAKEVVARARKAKGRGTTYRLGAGGMNPKAEYPTVNGGCDCSGMVAHALGISREQPGKIPGGWLETSMVYRDATTTHKLFKQVSHALPGDVIVYPDRGGKQGHIGIITATEDGYPTLICHCNARTKDAIAEEPMRAFWKQRQSIYARYLKLTPEPKDEGEEDLKKTVVRVNGKAFEGRFDAEKETNLIPFTAIKDHLPRGTSISWEGDVLDIVTPKPKQG